MKYDEMFDGLAAAQHGVFARRQALALGIPSEALKHRLLCGWLIRVHAGVYRLRSHPASWSQRIMAACLAAGEDGVASHRAAAYLHSLAGIEPAAEVSIPASARRRIPQVAVHRARSLDGADIESRDGIPRTRVARTLIDVASVVTSPGLEAALDDALSRRLVTVDYLARRLESAGHKGRRGTRELSRLLRARTDGRPRAQSRFERRLVEVLTAAGLPPPRTQFEVALPGGGTAILDAAYPELRIDLEADSFRYHSSAAAWSRDRIRRKTQLRRILAAS